MPEDWQSIAERKLADRNARIPKDWRLQALPSSDTVNVTEFPRTCGLLTKEEIDITENHDATALAEAIATRRLTCYDVTKAFCKRAAIAQQLTNCLTEIMFESAMRRASYLDHYLEKYGKPLSPLHGVPISLKDTLRVAKEDSSIGIAALAYRPSPTTSPLVSLLLSAGAVIYCKTNIPQTMMALDSVNNLFGRTINPLNRYVTAGGSSGGEGALVAMKASPLGVGTDIGGSIRIPAMCHGLYGIKPSANRVPFAGQEDGAMPGIGRLAVEASAGPITRSLRDCELFLSTVAAAKPWLLDPAIIPGLWTSMDHSTSADTPRPLNIGILNSDGVTVPLPPISSLITLVSEMLTSHGHKTHLITPPSSFRTCQSVANSIFSLDGNNTMLDLLEVHDEPLIPWLAGRLKRKPRATLVQAAALQAKREQLTTELLALWTTPIGEEIDAIVCPVAPHPVPLVDKWNGVGYTSAWVLLDCPAGTVPVRSFTEADLEGEIEESEPLSSWDKANRKLWDKSKIDRRLYLGTPLSVQVVAPRLQEKRLYRAMQAVDLAAKEHFKRCSSVPPLESNKAKL